MIAHKLPPFDLHVLGTPPAFILSQDQTLRIFFQHLSMSNFLPFQVSGFPITLQLLRCENVSIYFIETKIPMPFFLASVRQTDRHFTLVSDA